MPGAMNMNGRIAILATIALAASGCATYDDAYNQGYRAGRDNAPPGAGASYYAAAADGYGYYDRSEVAFNDYTPGWYGGYGFGFAYDPWFYNNWYCCRDRDDWGRHHGHDHDGDDWGRHHGNDHDADDRGRHGPPHRDVAFRPGPAMQGRPAREGRVEPHRESRPVRPHQ